LTEEVRAPSIGTLGVSELFPDNPMREVFAMKRFSISAVFLSLLFAVALSARAQMDMPKPGPELKKLDYFAGSWTTVGDMKPGPMGPGGEWTQSEHDEWMEGGYFLVLHSQFKGAMGRGTSVAYMGYDTNDKMYTYDEFNTMSEAEHSKGSVDGDTWTWTSEEKMGAQTVKGRYTMKIVSPTSYTMKFEMSPDGSKWETVMDGKATKTK
jgi:hypothetical protein